MHHRITPSRNDAPAPLPPSRPGLILPGPPGGAARPRRWTMFRTPLSPLSVPSIRRARCRMHRRMLSVARSADPYSWCSLASAAAPSPACSGP